MFPDRLPNATGLRLEVIEAVQAEVGRCGLGAFQAHDVIAMFEGRIGHQTLARWIDEVTRPAIPGEVMQRNRGLARTMPADLSKWHPAEELENDQPASADGPREVSFGDPTLLIRQIDQYMHLVKGCLREAGGYYGRPGDLKLMLAAAGHLRKGLAMEVRVRAELYEMKRVDRFHQLIMEEIGKESPECVQRILGKLRHMIASDAGKDDDTPDFVSVNAKASKGRVS